MDEGSDALGFVLILAAIVAFFIPTFIAYRRKHAYKHIILGLNFFGFTGFCWLAAFIWAVWPSEQSLADPVLGNVTGTGKRNVGDTLGTATYGAVRGVVNEHSETDEDLPVKKAIGNLQELGKSAGRTASTLMEEYRSTNKQGNALEQLGKLAELREKGVISQDEYQIIKQQLLNSL